MNWVLILWLVTSHETVATQISGLSEKGCKEQALCILQAENVNVLAFCIEKR